MKSLVSLIAFLALAGSAPAAAIMYHAVLDGASEFPPVVSTGTGTATATIDTDAHILRVTASFSDLVGEVTVAHIHAPTALPFEGTVGVATPIPTFPGFPAGVTSGSYDETFDLTMASSYNPAYIAANGGTPEGAEAALAAALAEGRAYLNIHTTFVGSGEIRGFLRPVPDGGSSLGLLMLAGGSLLGVARRLRKQSA